MRIAKEFTYRAGIGFCVFKEHIDSHSSYWILAIHFKLLGSGFSDWKKFTVVVEQYELWTLFFTYLIFKFHFLSIIQYMNFICVYLQPGIYWQLQMSCVRLFQISFYASIFFYSIGTINTISFHKSNVLFFFILDMNILMMLKFLHMLCSQWR